MNETLRKLIIFINVNNPEIHWDEREISGAPMPIIFISMDLVSEFMSITNNIDFDEEYIFHWKNECLAFDFSDFLENKCDISLEKFRTLFGE